MTAPRQRLLLSTAPILGLLIIWQIISASNLVNQNLFPPPSEILKALWSLIKSGTLIHDMFQSLWRWCFGLIIGSFIGLVIGLLTGRIPLWNYLLSPIIQLIRPLPPVALIPVMIVWFGIDNDAKIIAIALAVFFPMWVSTHIGAEQIPKAYIDSATFLTKSRLKLFTKVIFPATLPFSVAGFRNSNAIAFIMVFVSELAGASSGLGYRISISELTYRMDQMLAALLVLGLLGMITDQIIIYATRTIFPWLQSSRTITHY